MYINMTICAVHLLFFPLFTGNENAGLPLPPAHAQNKSGSKLRHPLLATLLQYDARFFFFFVHTEYHDSYSTGEGANYGQRGLFLF